MKTSIALATLLLCAGTANAEIVMVEPAVSNAAMDLSFRSFALGTGHWQANVDLLLVRASFTVGTTTDSAIGEALALGGGYGLNDKLTVGGTYFLTLNDGNDSTDFTPRGPLDLWADYEVLRRGKLTFGMSGGLRFDFAGKGAMDYTTEVGLLIGAAVRYEIIPKLFVTTGRPYSGVQYGGQLGIGFNNDQPIGLAIPVGVAYQATPQLYAFLDTNLMNVYFANGPADGMDTKSATFIFADYIPVSLGAFFSPNKMLDLGGAFSFVDLKEDAGIFAFSVSGRIHM